MKLTPQVYITGTHVNEELAFVGVAGSGRTWQVRGGVFDPSERQTSAQIPVQRVATPVAHACVRLYSAAYRAKPMGYGEARWRRRR